MQFNIQTQHYSDFLIPFEQEVLKTNPDLNEEKSLQLASMLFFDSMGLDFKINNDPILTQNTIDKLASVFLDRFFDREIGYETERKFKMKLRSVLNAKSDYYSQKFSMSFINFLNKNVSIKKEYERERNNNVNAVNQATGNGTSENSGTDARDSNVTRTTNENANQTDNNFNRDIVENTPDTRLNLTSNAADGSGTIKSASQIQEHKVTNKRDSEQEQQLTGVESSNGSQSGTASYQSNDVLNSDTVGKETDTYSDLNEGYDFRNVSQGKVYSDYINSLQRVYDEILDDCDKCFLQIWV